MTKKRRRRHRKSKLPEWASVRINERKRTITVKFEIEGFLREVGAPKDMTFVIRPKTIAIPGPGPYDYMLEARIGSLVVPGPLSVFFPDEKTHGREFFEKVKRVLGKPGALPRRKRKPRRHARPNSRRRCGNCRFARWPKDKRSLGKCMEPTQFEHSHCAEVWPDGRMKIKANWGSECRPFEEKA